MHPSHPCSQMPHPRPCRYDAIFVHAATHFQLDALSLIQLGKEEDPAVLKLNPSPRQLVLTQTVQRNPGLALPEEAMLLKLLGKLTQVPALLEPVNLRSRKSLFGLEIANASERM